ncbi:hypothetical protein GOC74_12260 [Halomicrobium mukohataei]|uniref:Uncharacterized protein n=1 Tax=Halomicrobium mukohataei TaxID=57705 RepID=A0A847UEN4_9EURY|nr:hypothetical protein [Halomicrobium mukohataei]NLV10697.1 hypothetical protein [Halomicrobium mukohataei]
MGTHDEIPSPSYIPEVKGHEGLRAILDHIDALEPNNPIMVPAAKWSKLRERNIIVSRTNEDGEEIGESEIEELEENHPLVYYDPPELYNYKRTRTLTNYLFKHGAWNGERFDELFRQGHHKEGLRELPEFVHPFIHANVNRVLEEIDGASQVSPSSLEINSTEQAWTSLEPRNFDDYYQVLAVQAAKRPSAVVVPPVPQLSREWNEHLVDAWSTSNARMAKEAADKGTEAYYHLYIDYQAFDAEASEDTASQALRVLDRELDENGYAGIALTVHQPNRIWQTNKAARMQTFVEDLSRIGDEHELPIICPRSEWFGSFITDLGVQAFSSLLNGQWQYSRYSSGGGPTGADKYGSTMIPNEARALKVQSDDREDLEGYLEAYDGLPDVKGLPSRPPTYDESAGDLKEKFGTSPEFRRTFGKPRRLAHVEEARRFREQRAEGVQNPAREYLKDSENPYIEV